MPQRFLTALPVFNEVRHVEAVLKEVRRYSPEVLVVDDGSTDGTAEVLARQANLHLVTHPQNRGYGAALKSAFQFAADRGYETLVTIDCDGQHQPQRIPQFVAAMPGVDIVSGSRYLQPFPSDTPPPEQRRLINRELTRELNRRLGLSLTDAFCGFKAYRVESLGSLRISDDGYAMPLELWVQAAHQGFRVIELPVPLIYLDETRSFGGSLDDAQIRLQHYYDVIDRAQAAVERQPVDEAASAACGDVAG